MRRREFLEASLALSLAACGPRAPSSSKLPIVIVGAGLAGLTVARELAARGRDVMVLEAQDRPGGRIFTVRAPLATDAWVECGAIHVVGDPDLLDLAKSVGVSVVRPKGPTGLARVRLREGKRERYEPGDEIPPRFELREDERKLAFFDRVARTFSIVKGVDPSSPIGTFAKYDSVNALEMLGSLGASPGLVAELVEAFVADRPERLSGGFLLQQLAGFFRDYDLGAAGGRFEGGTDRLPVALARELGERVVYRAEVRRIDVKGEVARVSFEQGGASHTVEASRIVIAVPFSVLRGLVLDAPLRDAKRRVIRELPMARAARAFAAMDRRFWIEQGEQGDADTDAPLGAVRDETKAQVGEGGILGAYLVRDAAERWTSLAKDARREAFLAHLERVFPGAKARTTAFFEHAWDEDPFAKGAYAYYEKGQLATLGPLAAAPEGVLHFAGDHTSARPGWMHGAVASAKRVVREITST